MSESQPSPPYCDRCEWDGKRLIARCFVCRRDARENGPTRRGHGASEGDPSL